jgi:conjugal transfer pilus assembly protein TraW
MRILNSKRRLAFLGLTLSLTTFCYAKNIGTIGQAYPILEEDFIEFIQTRASDLEKSGSFTALQNSMKTKAKQYRDRPTRVEGIGKTQKEKSWLFDPSIVLDHDVNTPDGRTIAFRGTHINPLAYVPLSKILIFYDADDKNQHDWAVNLNKKLKGKDKIILVNGSMLDEEKSFPNPIYFDQSGRLSKHFGIHHVPAVVDQDGMLLRIREVKP